MKLPDKMAHDPLIRAISLLDVQWSRVIRAVGLGSLALGSSVGLAAVSAWLIARASQMPSVTVLSVAVVAVRAFGIGRGVFRYLERLASHDVALRGMSSLRTNLYTRLASGRVSAVVGLRRGDLLARVSTDVDGVGDFVVRGMIPFGVAVVLSLGSVVLVGAFLPVAGLTLLICLLLAGLLGPWLSMRAARVTEVSGSAARAGIAGTTLEILESAGPLAVSGRVESRMEALRGLDRDLARANDDGARVSGLGAGITTGAIVLSALASLLVGIPAVHSGALAPVELAVIVLTPLACFEAAGALSPAAVQWQRSKVAARRIIELIDAADLGPGAQQGATLDPARAGRPENLRMSGVTCGWPDARDEPVAAGISLDIAPGRAIALVGPSGIGKTTLLTTAAGLIPALAGHVELDGEPLADMALDEAAHHVVFVAEDGHVFDTSVLENLRVARGDLDEAEARALLDRVGLGPWLMGLPKGLATPLGADGTTISGGERRRLLVARGLASPAPLLLVDEPAEHLDPRSGDELMSVLVDSAHDDRRGVVVATHRLSALARMDEVILLGRPGAGATTILARGSHEDLLARDDYRWSLDQEVLA